MKKIYILILAVSMSAFAQAQIDLTVTMDNHNNMDATSDDPLNMDFTVTNNGVDLTDQDTIYFGVSIGSTYYTTTGLTSGQVSGGTVTGGLVNGAAFPVDVDDLLGSWLTTELGGSSGQVRVVCIGVGDSVLAAPFSSESPADALDNIEFVNWSDASGINDLNLSEISAFPNPASTHVNISLGDNQIDFINILDLTGKVVDRIQVSNAIEVVSLTDYQSGIYFYQIVNDGEVLLTEKIVVSK